MNVIDYIMITCNLKNERLYITSDYMKKCNRLQLITITITITPCLPSGYARVSLTYVLRNKTDLWSVCTYSIIYFASIFLDIQDI